MKEIILVILVAVGLIVIVHGSVSFTASIGHAIWGAGRALMKVLTRKLT
jgi:hypothetical protein